MAKSNSVVVWGAFLVLLLGNMVKLSDSATQKLWVEIASQVLNGFFTIANVPVHPKRFLGLVRGLRIWKKDRSIRMRFVATYLGLEATVRTDVATREEQALELLRMLDFYRCFPAYGRHRNQSPVHITMSQSLDASQVNESIKSPAPIPMPAALTTEQMNWIDEQHAALVQQQDRLQKAWPWYHYTVPAGIEPVDFFAPLPKTSSHVVHDTRMDGLILLRSLPSDIVTRPSRFCCIVGSFNLNSMIQEVLCGFMWGMNYHVRPSWVVGLGMVLGCMAAIVPSVMILRQERSVSIIRVAAVAVVEEEEEEKEEDKKKKEGMHDLA
ncbi:hypothetical protein BG011_007228 [Mortierella polycephala]|uniref:Uncharacterized protein n=1 Tax=Mortierella polycephala TaxID=41804 RepID=A0A9P6PSR6_9FUNG|nr:hypothetical protein BG011_007228 [Mortierella polycephala]